MDEFEFDFDWGGGGGDWWSGTDFNLGDWGGGGFDLGDWGGGDWGGQWDWNATPAWTVDVPGTSGDWWGGGGETWDLGGSDTWGTTPAMDVSGSSWPEYEVPAGLTTGPMTLDERTGWGAPEPQTLDERMGWGGPEVEMGGKEGAQTLDRREGFGGQPDPETKAGGGGWSAVKGGLDEALRYGPLAEKGLGGVLSVLQYMRQRQYDDAVKRWQSSQADRQAKYDAEFFDWMTRRKEWEGRFAEEMGAFREHILEAIGGAQEVMQEALAAAKQYLGGSAEMLGPAIAALTRGEVPQHWQPLLAQIRSRGYAAAMNPLVSAGMSPQAAQAAVIPQIDQMAMTLLMQLAQGMMSGATGLGDIASKFFGPAVQGASVSAQAGTGFLDALARELQVLFGSWPGPGTNVPAPGAPTA